MNVKTCSNPTFRNCIIGSSAVAVVSLTAVALACIFATNTAVTSKIGMGIATGVVDIAAITAIVLICLFGQKDDTKAAHATSPMAQKATAPIDNREEEEIKDIMYVPCDE